MAKPSASADLSNSKKVIKNKAKAKAEYTAAKGRLNELFKSIRGKSAPNITEEVTPCVTQSSSNKSSSPSRKNKENESYARAPISGSARKRTEDNLPIYTVEELNIGNGGGTELCPFDCDCCY
ncbi:DUF1764 family protein, putative [Babesia ovis]|uniref:DUF1764 family protein, putative n=1 Tax=Babesia ovis TaxID=5869 RepID=A0A9W5TD96_BABOV|nr:DUF1764 family protein, putative [Babesia ovis]